MTQKKSKLNRRKFMAVSSIAIASPLALGLTETASAATTPAASAAKPPLDLSKKTYYIPDGCVGCNVCKMFCPAGAIFFGERKMEIDQEKCLHCGTCYNECPVSNVTVI